jgi:hypothetical protein
MKQKFFTLILFLLGFGHKTLAATDSSVITLPNPLNCEDIPCVVQNIANGLFYIATPIVVVMVLIGAFQILIAGGNPEKITKGRNTIFYAVVGYAVVLVAQGLALIIKEVLGG